MKITFRINYLTCYGQQLMIDSIPGVGVALMTPKQNGDWELTIDSDSLPQKTFSYKYLMKDNNVSQTLYEFGDRTFCLPELASDNILVRDFWKPNVSATNVMNSSAFKDVIFHREPVADFKSATVREENKAHLRLSISLTRVLPNHYVGVRFINSLVEKDATIRLSDQYFPMWKCECTVNIPKQYSEYKYCICEKGTDKLILEEYVTRYFTPEEDKDFYILNDEDFKFPRYPWKGAGVAIPVFSLRSDEDFGVGEFMDLIPLIDWAKSVGLRMIQLLPVNDTVLTHTWKDSYPYNCVSVFALHPMYLRVSEMPKISSKVTEEILLEKKPALNQLKKIDYEEVMRVKSRIYKTIYDDNHRQRLRVERTDTLQPGTYRLTAITRTDADGAYLYAIADGKKSQIAIPANGEEGGNIWEEAKTELNLHPSDSLKYADIIASNDSSGCGWNKVTLDNIVLTGKNIKYGISTVPAFTNSPCYCTWVNSMDFRLEKVK